MTCDFDLLIGAVEDKNHQRETTFKVPRNEQLAVGVVSHASNVHKNT